jgi:voltage-gated sodium channel
MPSGATTSEVSHAEAESARSKVARFVESKGFRWAILGVIALNAITLGLQTSETVQGQVGSLLNLIDWVALGIFIAELTLRVYAHRLDFFRDAWSDFDFIVVLISLAGSGSLSVLRALRALRLLRTIKFVPGMRRVVSGLQHAVPGLLSVVPLLALFIYVWAVMGTTLFGEALPVLFGDLGAAMYSLFQTMTFEGWPDIATRLTHEYPVWGWVYLLPFILITAFAVVNLFIAVVVDAMQTQLVEEVQAVEETVEAEQRAEEEIAENVRVLSDEVRGLRTEFADYQTSDFKRFVRMAGLVAVTMVLLRRPRTSRH